MRTALFVALALAGGSAVGTGFQARGRGTAEDLISFDLSGAVPGVHYVGLNAPDDGELLSLLWTTTVAGVGVGNATFQVMQGGNEVCAVTVPCTQAPGQHVSTTCSVELTADQHMDVQPGLATGCLVQPKGMLVAAFQWR